MKVLPEHEQASKDAIAHVRRCAVDAAAKGLQPLFVAHAMLVEAMVQLYECTPERAVELATGMYVATMADQNQYVAGKIPDVLMQMSRGPGTYSGARTRALAGFAQVGPVAF